MTPHEPVPPLLREQLRLGELPDDRADDVRARLDALSDDPDADLPTDARTFADDPPEAFARAVRARAAEIEGRAQLTRRRAARWAVPLLAAAVALLAIVPLLGDLIGDDDPSVDVVAKGGPMLSVYAQRKGRAQLLDDGAPVAAGDRLQLAFVATGMAQGVIFSVDGRGNVTEHHRFGAEERPTGPVVLDRSYVLDDAPAFEVFHLVAAPHAFDVDAVLIAARARGAEPGPPAPPTPRAVVRTLRLSKADR